MDCLVPSSTFQEEAIAEDTVIWFLGDILVLDLIVDLEVEAELIDSYDILSCKVLHCTSEESLWEEES